MDYAEAISKLTGRCWQSRKLANNTYLKRRAQDAVAVRLHSTDILTFHKDGRIDVSTGGWNTITTKDRINRFLPTNWSVWSEHGYMFLGRIGGSRAAAFEGYSVTIDSDGTVSGGVPAEEMRRRIKDENNELRRPRNRARYWIRKAQTIVRDSSDCNKHWCRCHPRAFRRNRLPLQEGTCECGCKFVRRTPSAGKLTVQDILNESNQTVRAAKISLYGMERFILDAGAGVIDERSGYELIEVRFSSQWRDRIKALKMKCPSTGAVYLNTVPPDIDTVESGLRFMFDLPEGVNYFANVIQQA